MDLGEVITYGATIAATAIAMNQIALPVLQTMSVPFFLSRIYTNLQRIEECVNLPDNFEAIDYLNLAMQIIIKYIYSLNKLRSCYHSN